MLQLDIMGTGKSIQQDARNKLGSPPSYICDLNFGCHVSAFLFFFAPKDLDYLALQSFDSGTNGGYSKKIRRVHSISLDINISICLTSRQREDVSKL